MTRLTEQYVSEIELNSIKGLIHYLNENVPASAAIAVEAELTDGNGERIGVIKPIPGTAGGYALHYMTETDT